MFDLEFDNKYYFTFIAAAEYEDKLYISDPNNRGLLEYNLGTKETVIKIYLWQKMKEIIIGRHLHIMVKYGLFH